MGTPVYMAPEMHQAAEMPCKAQQTDIFSLGVVFFMLAFGAPPFHSAVNTDSFFSFLALQPGNSNFFRFHPHTRGLFSSKKIPQSFMDLLLKMLMVKPADRVQEPAELLDFAFFAEQQDEDEAEEENTTSMCHTDVMKSALTELINDMNGNQED